MARSKAACKAPKNLNIVGVDPAQRAALEAAAAERRRAALGAAPAAVVGASRSGGGARHARKQRAATPLPAAPAALEAPAFSNSEDEDCVVAVVAMAAPGGECMEHTSTEDATAQTNVASCVVDAGYGYYDGEVKQCEFAYYSAAGGRDACEFCGLGYNTTDDTLVGIKGADSAEQCDIAAGWEADSAAGVKQCVRGSYNPTISAVPCTKCVSGTTTSLMAGAIAESDCDTCRPGFGGDVDVSAPSCTLCTSDYYSPGYTPGGQDCVACPHPESFSGKMVSRNGIFTPEDCVGEFVSDGSVTTLEWDILKMPASALTANAADTVEACQAACSGDSGCQYYEFTSYNVAGSRCKLRTAGGTASSAVVEVFAFDAQNCADRCTWYDNCVSHTYDGIEVCTLTAAGAGPQQAAAIAKLDFAGENAPATALLFFEAREGLYTVYAAADANDAEGVGETLHSYTTFAWTGTFWRSFAGTKWEGATGKVRVVGETLNSWIAEPSAN